MTIKTCSKESGQRLVELGVERESALRWYCLVPPPLEDSDTSYFTFYVGGSTSQVIYPVTPAFTACELGEVLPIFTMLKKENGLYYITCLYHNDTKQDSNPAEAMALMLIWLLENNHLRLEDINEAK